MSSGGEVPPADRLPPVRMAITVPLSPREAFDLFTLDIARWWPLREHSVSRDEGATCRFEGGANGQLVEIAADGARHVWGVVQVWEPGERFVVSWHPGRAADSAQRLEVRFLAERNRDSCRVELEHSGWERLGALAGATRAEYEGGWRAVLGRHYEAAARRAAQARSPRSGAS